MYSWTFSCHDNGGFSQHFTVKARSKEEAIKKGFARARKHARGDISPDWTCKLIMIF